MESPETPANVTKEPEPRTGKISDIFGAIKTDIKLSIEEMNQAAIDGCIEEYLRGIGKSTQK